MSDDEPTGTMTRRNFLKNTVAGGVVVSTAGVGSVTASGKLAAATVSASDAIIWEEYLQATQAVEEFSRTLPNGIKLTAEVSPPQDLWLQKCHNILEKHGVPRHISYLFHKSPDLKHSQRFEEPFARARDNNFQEMEKNPSSDNYQENILKLEAEMKFVRAVRAFSCDPKTWAAFAEVAEFLKTENEAAQTEKSNDKLSKEQEFIADLSNEFNMFLDKEGTLRVVDKAELWVSRELEKMKLWPDDYIKTKILVSEFCDIADFKGHSEARRNITSVQMPLDGNKPAAPTMDVLRLRADINLVDHCCRYYNGLSYNANGQLVPYNSEMGAAHQSQSYENQKTALKTLQRDWLTKHPIGTLDDKELGAEAREIIEETRMPKMRVVQHNKDEASPSFLSTEVPLEDTKGWFVDAVQQSAGMLPLVENATGALEDGASYVINLAAMSAEQKVLANLRAETIAHGVEGVEVVHSAGEDGKPQLQLTVTDPKLIAELTQPVDVQLDPNKAEVEAQTSTLEQDSRTAGK